MRRTVPKRTMKALKKRANAGKVLKFQHSAGRTHWLATNAVRGGSRHGSAYGSFVV